MGEVSKGEGRTVLFVSHNMGAVKSLCNRGILLKNGLITHAGEVNTCIDIYNQSDNDFQLHYDTSDLNGRKRGLKQIYVASMTFDKGAYYPTSSMSLQVKVKKQDPTFEGKVDLSMYIFDRYQNVLFHLSTFFKNCQFYLSESDTYQFSIDELGLSNGIYSIGMWVAGNGIEQDYVENVVYFEVESDSIYMNKNVRVESIIQKHFEVEQL